MDYLKCIRANRCSLVGFVLLAIFLPSTITAGIFRHWWLYDLVCPPAILGFALFAVTGFGMVTLGAYRRTKKHIARFGRIDERFEFIAYCSDCGRYLAAKEAGIEIPIHGEKEAQ